MLAERSGSCHQFDAQSGPKAVLAVTNRYACITKSSGSMILVIQSASDGSLHPDPGVTEIQTTDTKAIDPA
jgi:hypothetical protein